MGFVFPFKKNNYKRNGLLIHNSNSDSQPVCHSRPTKALTLRNLMFLKSFFSLQKNYKENERNSECHRKC